MKEDRTTDKLIKRWRLAAGVAIGGAGLLLTGCGGDGDDSYTTTTATDVQQEQRSEQLAAQESGAPASAEVQDSAEVVLREETMEVGKRAESAGGVLLRKTVEEEPANETVELRQEEIEVVRLSPEEARQRADGAQAQFTEEFAEEEVFIPLHREEAVAEKDVAVREVVQAETEMHTEQAEVQETLRREELETERVMQDEQDQYVARQQFDDFGSQDLQQQIKERLRAELGLDEEQLEQLEIDVEQRNVTVNAIPDQATEARIRQQIEQMEEVDSVTMDL